MDNKKKLFLRGGGISKRNMVGDWRLLYSSQESK